MNTTLDVEVIYYEGNTALSPIDNFTLADPQGNIVSFTQEAINDPEMKFNGVGGLC